MRLTVLSVCVGVCECLRNLVFREVTQIEFVEEIYFLSRTKRKKKTEGKYEKIKNIPIVFFCLFMALSFHLFGLFQAIRKFVYFTFPELRLFLYVFF